MAGGSYPGAMRASDDDRSKVQALLNDAFAEGRLTQQEWEQRATELATAATYADLDRLTADLPGRSLSLQYAPAGPPMPWQPAQRTNRLAVAALACGIGQMVVWWPATILAIVLGHKARREIRQTGEQGDGLARAGIILGYIGLGLTLGVVLLVLVGTVAFTHHAAHLPPPLPAP
jgi:Domain of unknown function (DUF4190)/Domain of unknown function (DUF1707)